MTQYETICDLFHNNSGVVSNLMLRDAGLSHTGRNRIGDYARRELWPRGKHIRFVKGKSFLENEWRIVDDNDIEETVRAPEYWMDGDGQVYFT